MLSAKTAQHLKNHMKKKIYTNTQFFSGVETEDESYLMNKAALIIRTIHLAIPRATRIAIQNVHANFSSLIAQDIQE